MTDTKEEPFPDSGDGYWANLDVNDGGYLLRVLEREAFTSVVNALRAKGPPSEHTFLLLDHLKSALSINDELGRAEIRRAAFDPKLCQISNVLNPNYDTCTEWSGCSLEARGIVEAGPSRGKSFASTSSTSIADQLLSQATNNNEKINRSIGQAFELLCLPNKPFIPERLRLLLRETDRAEQRTLPPLEMILPPSVSITSGDKSGRSEGRQATIKKRRTNKPRTNKVVKEKKISVKSRKSPKIEEGPSVPSIVSEASTSSSSVPIPVTPLAVNAALNLSAVIGSAGSTVISPGQPPQSGDAMKTWVSKIHEQEMAASAAVNGGGGIVSTEETIITSIPTPTVIADDGKKKRRPRAQQADPYYLNSCARTRPFQFERATNGKLKPPRGNPDTSEPSSSSAKQSSSGVQEASTGVPSVVIPSVKPNDVEPRLESNRNGTMEVSPAVHSSTASTSAGPSPSGYSSGGGSSGSRSSFVPPPIIPPPYLANHLKRSHGSMNSSRTAAKYFVNNSGVGVPAPPGSSNAVRNLSNTGGIGARTSSLGSQQQLSSLHGMSSGVSFIGQKPCASTSNTSINSIGGASMDSGIGASSSSSNIHLNGESVVNPADMGGHDYSFIGPPSSTMNPAPHQTFTGVYNGMRDPTGGLRITPRVPPRPRINSALSRNPGFSHTSPQPFMGSNGLSLSPSAISLHSSSPSPMVHPLHRAGSMSNMIRPRTGSRGAVVSIGGGVIVGGRVTPSGERIVATIPETVTDGIIQATVNTIMLEAAQKECANGKRSTVPKELLERENGVSHGQSSIAGPFDQSNQWPRSFSTVFQSPSIPITTMPLSSVSSVVTSGLAGNEITLETISSSSSLNRSMPTVHLIDPPSSITTSIPTISSPSNSTLSPINPYLSKNLAATAAAYNQYLNTNGEKMVGPPTTSIEFLPPPVPPSRKKLNDIQIERVLSVVHPTPSPPHTVHAQPSPSLSLSRPVEAAALTAAIEAHQPIQRQFILQPEGKKYKDINKGNSKSMMMTTEQMYDSGILARPSTSGMMDGGRGGGGIEGIGGFAGTRSSILQETQSVPRQYNYVIPAPHLATMAAIQFGGVAPSFPLPPPIITELSSNGEMPSSSRDGMIPPNGSCSSPQLQQILERPVVPVRGDDKIPSDDKDILEQSCRELQ